MVTHRGNTYLNACSILSKMGNSAIPKRLQQKRPPISIIGGQRVEFTVLWADGRDQVKRIIGIQQSSSQAWRIWSVSRDLEKLYSPETKLQEAILFLLAIAAPDANERDDHDDRAAELGEVDGCFHGSRPL
jgi:hypothetical protein